MGPRTLRLVLTVSCLLLAAIAVEGQVFVVGMKSATDDVVTEFHPTHIEISDAPLDERGHLELIRDLEAEQGFAHRELPLGAGLTLIANGNMTPSAEEYKKMLYQKGQSAAPGDRVAITNLQFKGDRIVIDFNGGPYAKHRFLSHISINDSPIAQLGPVATGCRITLVFEGGGIPEVTAAEVKALLDPLVDFRAKTSDEAYANTLPSKAREAIEAHEVLVGMDRRMVLASIGAPHDKHREHASIQDGNSQYEEWIYGEPPQPTKFVRFQNGRVVRMEIAALGKPVEIHEKNELGTDAAPTLQTRVVHNGDAIRGDEESGVRASAPPTLRKPGDKDDLSAQSTMGRVNLPPDTPKQHSNLTSNR